ncbi:MAG TPA: MFS transporter [Methylomirabilota bacterium]|nr:MFS transporter [Methylomirabilota bacterium]
MAFERPRTRRNDRDHILLSCFWLAYNFEWGALLPVVLPSQIAAIVGDARKELFNGLVPAAGAALSLVVTPLAGALSDRSRSRIGRRRPFLAVGTTVNILFLFLLARIGAGGSIGVFLLSYLGVQLGANWAGGPYAGLIPDLVPSRQRGQASGWLALMTAAGTLLGVIAAGALIVGRGYGSIYLAIAGTLAVLCAITLLGVKEKPLVEAPAPIRGRAFAASFLLRGPRYRDFYFVLFTRALVTMGIYSVFTFFQFFLKDVVRSENPARDASYLIGIIIATGVPTSLLAGALSDHFGRKPLVYWSGGLMAAASLLFIGVGLVPSLAAMLWIGALFGVGYGAYQAVDWALAIDVLPQGNSAAKDMGIWHVSLVLPQVIAPALTGIILSALKSRSLLLGYTVVFTSTALWFILGTVFVRQIRGAR